MDLDAIRRRAEAACPGPWQAYNGNEGTEYAPYWAVANDAYHNPPADDDAPWIAVHIETGIQADMEFIAHARQDIPDLIAEVERLRDLLARADRQRFAVEGWGDRDGGEIELAHDCCWNEWIDKPITLADLNRRADEHTEVCR